MGSATKTLKMILLGQDLTASKSLKGVGDEADKTKIKLGDIGSGFSDLGKHMSAIMGIASTAGPAFVAAGSALSATAAGATALVGAIGPGAVGGAVAYAGALGAVAQASLVTKFAIQGMDKAVSGDAKALAALAPEARSFAKALTGLKPEVDKIRRSAQSEMFSGLTKPLNRLASDYLPRFNKATDLTAHQVNLLAKEAAHMAEQPVWQSSFSKVTTGLAKDFGLLGKGGLQLAQAVRPIIVAALPLVHTFSQWALGAATAIAATTAAVSKSGALVAFFDKASATGAQLGRILGDVAGGIFNVFKIGASPAGSTMLNVVEGLAQGFRDWTTSTSGMAKISAFFADGQRNLAAMGGLIKSITTGLSTLGSGQSLAPLIDQITNEVIPPLIEFLHNASAAGALQALVSAVGDVVQVFATLSASDSSLTAFSETLGALASAAELIMTNVPGASSALALMFTALGAGAALKTVGLMPVLKAFGGGLLTIAKRALIVAGAETTETGALTANSIARGLSTSYIGTWIGVKALELGAWVRSTAAAIASTAAVTASTAAGMIATGAAKAWAGAQWLLNAALTANPIGAVVVGVAALAAGFIYAYQHSEKFRDIVNGAFDAIKKVISLWWDGVKIYFGLVVGAFDKIKNAAGSVIGWIKGHWPLLLGIITGPIGIAVLVISRNWDRIKEGATTAKQWIGDKFDALVGFISRLPKRIGTAAAGMFGGIKDAFKSAINWIIGKWNGLSFSLPSVDTHIKGIGKVGGFTLSTPDIPMLAKGGVVTRPTLAVVGEAGPEAVIPLGKFGGAPRFGGGSASSPAIEQRLDRIERAIERISNWGDTMELRAHGSDLIAVIRKTQHDKGQRQTV